MEMIGQGHETAVAGTTITWSEMGEGEPLVLLHGILDSHRAWRRAAPHLARHFRVLMPDLPGHGYSGRPDAPYTLTWYASVIAAWMEAIGVERAHVCGHSYGGGVAQWMLLEQRARIDRLALVSAGGLGRGVAPAMRFATFPGLGPLLTPAVMRVALPAAVRLAPAMFGYMEPEEQDLYLMMRRIPGSEMAFQRTIGGVINFFGQYMQTIQRAAEVGDMPPIAIFWGAKDPVIPVRHGRDAVARSEGITLTVYKKCGHSCHLDAPERFAKDLTEFLLDPSRPPARFLPPTRKTRVKDFFAPRKRETSQAETATAVD
jgi:pimeloyl-ACP methyl ester carboxylesterase